MIQINDCALLSDQLRAYLGRPRAIGADYSLSALLRAIVLDKDENVALGNMGTKCGINTNSVRDMPQSDFHYYMQEDEGDCALHFVFVESANSIKALTAPEGWITFDEAPYMYNRYLSQFSVSKVFINPELQKITVAVTPNVSESWIEAFESLLFKFMPWYFPPSDEVDPFFKSISVGAGGNRDKIILDYCDRIYEKMDFRKAMIENLLKGVGDASRQIQIDSYKRTVENTKNQIARYEQELGILYKQLADNDCILEGLLLVKPNGDEEVINFFLNHKNVYLTSRDDRSGIINYYVVDYMEDYDSDALKRVVENKNSWFNQNGYRDLDALKALFVERRGLIKVEGVFRLTSMKKVDLLSHNHINGSTMPNPHIYNYACDGEAGKYYSQYAKEGAWDLAVEQSIGSTKNWNISDTTVSNAMINYIQRVDSITPYILVNKDLSPITGKFNPDEMEHISYNEFVERFNKMNSESTESEESNG